MARGWESKHVESQQEALSAERRPTEPVTDRDRDRGARRATLLLARTRAFAELQHARAPAHRAMLEQAIADLDQQIAAIDA